MTMLTVGTFANVPVANQDQAATYEPIGGEVVRMFDGSARTTVRGYKRTWPIVTPPIADATATTLIGVITATTQPVTCSGDLLGGSVSCITQLVSSTAVNKRGAIYRRVSFKLIEV